MISGPIKLADGIRHFEKKHGRSPFVSVGHDERGRVVFACTANGHTTWSAGTPESARQFADMVLKAADAAEKLGSDK